MTSQISNVKSQNQNSNSKSANVKVRAYKFSLEIIKFADKLPNKRVFWIIEDQLIRATTSIGANMIEAKASSSKRDFIKFYEIALKSANETIYWLSLLRDTLLENKDICNSFIAEATEISKMLGASVLTLKGKK